MTSRRSTTVPGPLAGLLALLVGVLSVLLVAPAPAARAASDNHLSVMIGGLSPSSLGSSGTVRMTGTIKNTGKTAWSDVQAYLVIRGTPLISRATLAEAVETDRGFAGERIVDTGRFDEVGDLAAGQSVPFRIEVPVEELPINGANGVYPVGVQILGTDADGERSTTAVARATTLLPKMSDGERPAATTVVWPLIMPTSRSADETITDADALLKSISPSGSLRSLLDLALSSPPDGRGFLIDPALVTAAADLAEGVHAGRDLTDAEKDTAAAFRDDLIMAAASPSAWILDYDRTDVLALTESAGARRRLFGAVERATDSVVNSHALSRSRVSWPTLQGVSDRLLRSLRERGADPVIVSSSVLSDWTTADGVLVERPTSGGDLPMLVNDDITRGIPGATTVATLRQRILSSAALASLEGGRREALVLVDPELDPGEQPMNLMAPYLQPRSLDAVPRGERYTADVPTTARNKPISANQVAAADAAAQSGDLLSTAAVESKDLDDRQARALASVLGVRWRDDRSAGTSVARALGRKLADTLASITVAGPESVTLSSASGAFPLTISNGSDAAIRVGVRLDSSNPALDLPDQKPIEIAAGERRTVTVDIDLAEQNATTVTAHLTTPDGRTFGSSEEFIVRSSRVGVVLWATMAAAGLFVVLALVRRFTRRRRSGRTASPAGEPDE